MNKDLTFGFIAKSIRSSGKSAQRKIAIPSDAGLFQPDAVGSELSSSVSLNGIQLQPVCRYPYLQLLMHVHNQILANAHIIHDDVSFAVNIKANDWLSRSRLVFSDYSSIRNSERMGLITHGNIEELLICLSTTLAEYAPYYRKRYTFSFLLAFSYSQASDTYTLNFPLRLLTMIDITGDLIQTNLTERLLKRRAILYPLFDYLRKANRTAFRVCELTKCLGPGRERVRIMPNLICLAEMGLIQFVSDGRGESRIIEELEIIPYAQRALNDALTIEEISSAAA